MASSASLSRPGTAASFCVAASLALSLDSSAAWAALLASQRFLAIILASNSSLLIAWIREA
jgi:hypothetical protein